MNDFKKKLTAEQFRVTQKHGTEPPFSGVYNNKKDKGEYLCVCCKAKLFSSTAKYDSGSGWPAFFEPISENALGSSLPSISINKQQLGDKINIVDLIIMSKLESSKSEIRRLIKGSGVKINNQVIADEKLIITKNLFKDSSIKLSLGKKRHIKVKLN